ncbi:hypothetical protein AMTR_s00037p00115660 [Amborella trichopoda]|uniref:Uncharacterized protein n=1 Tax=Amborella trichopoda TaxID=13333 RepID=U5CVH8_AMBTC|nr:hypothetical protein AMTR_s00037p00115660 [Amborella trichopoda]
MLRRLIVVAETNIHVSVLLELFGRMRGGAAGITIDLPLIHLLCSRSIAGHSSFARAWKQATLPPIYGRPVIIYRHITPYRSAMQSSNGTSLPCNASGPDRNHWQGSYMMPVQYGCSDDYCCWLPYLPDLLPF